MFYSPSPPGSIEDLVDPGQDGDKTLEAKGCKYVTVFTNWST